MNDHISKQTGLVMDFKDNISMELMELGMDNNFSSTCSDCRSTDTCNHLGEPGKSEQCPYIAHEGEYETSYTLRNVDKKRGTRELSDVSINTLLGCTNNCKYCYAAHNAAEKGIIRSRDNWQREWMKKKQPDLNYRYEGVVMYPTGHDITSKNLVTHVNTVQALLEAGNELLVCSKADFACMRQVAEVCQEYRDKVVFMITITTLDEATSLFWEPNAPLPFERIATLEQLHHLGFRTSVLVEPLLQGPGSAIAIYDRVADYVSEGIWFGTMVLPEKRVDCTKPENKEAVDLIKRYQSKSNMRLLYAMMKDLPKVNFKKSIQSLV